MIESESTFGTTTITCDFNDCNEDFEHEGFDGKPDYATACAEAKIQGWKIIYDDGEYLHFCSVQHLNMFKEND